MKNDVDITAARGAPESLTGIIVPIEWDEDGTPLAIAIATEDEKEYRIDDANRKGRSLRKLLRKRVSIQGAVSGESIGPGRKLVKVSSFKLLEKERF
jgi:hypothetical protein